MKQFTTINLTLAICLILLSSHVSNAQKLPPKKITLNAMRIANDYFMDKWPDTGKEITLHKTWPSNIWTRGVYYEGLMALYSIDKQDKYYDYAVNWGESHKWNFRDGIMTRNADNQCAGQTYIDLYEIAKHEKRIENVKASIDSMMVTDKVDDWDWIDAIQMAMPVFAQLGRIYKDDTYFERMYEMYNHTKNIEGENGMYNKSDGLWWRDKDFDPPYTEPNGEDCYWSRGNGWVIAALVRVLEQIPEDEGHRKEYITDFKSMAKALAKVQREDGFWNVSLHDPDNYGGKETTGTALFVYGMAWGINNGILSEKKYMPVIEKAWNGILKDAIHENGFIGYVQGTGKEPASSQPVAFDKQPDFEDFGLGCFLLAGSEVYKLSK